MQCNSNINRFTVYTLWNLNCYRLVVVVVPGGNLKILVIHTYSNFVKIINNYFEIGPLGYLCDFVGHLLRYARKT